MTIQLNHVIVHAHDKFETAQHLVELLGLPEPTPYGPFLVVTVDNGVSLDVFDDQGAPHAQHYAFLVSDDEFDAIHSRLRDRGMDWWADPFQRRPREINNADGGRALYWERPQRAQPGDPHHPPRRRKHWRHLR